MLNAKPTKLILVLAAFVAALALYVFWFSPEDSNDRRAHSATESGKVEPAKPHAKEASSTVSQRDAANPYSEDSPGIADVEDDPCKPMSELEREKLIEVSRDWYGRYGDASAKRYWPYQTVDNDTLEGMSKQGDTEAMFQLGMNMLWQAVRIEGSRWFPEGSKQHRDTPFRDDVDKEKFYEAWRYLLAAYDGGMIFANRELNRVFIEFDSLDADYGYAEGREGFTAQEWKEINIASIEIMENYFFPGLPNERLSFELTDRQRTRADAFAANHHLSMVRRYETGSVPAPWLEPPPDAIRQLYDDAQCINRLAQQQDKSDPKTP